VDLDELHRAAVSRQHRQRGEPNVFAVRRVGVLRLGRNRIRAVSARVPKSAHDVLRFDARPHDDAHLRERGTDLGELDGKRLLGAVDVSSALQQFELFVDVSRAQLGPDGRAAVTLRAAGRNDHEVPPCVLVRGDATNTGEACEMKRA
jgi:hypothetical protein